MYRTFRDFWPFYVREHSVPLNRILHLVGTSGTIACVVLALVLHRPWLFALAPVSGYGFAWFGHFIVEKNRPATFKYPFYSLGADFVMLACMLTGRMGKEIERAKTAS